MSREVVVISVVRTAIGTFDGSLKDVPLCVSATSSAAKKVSMVQAKPEGVQRLR